MSEPIDVEAEWIDYVRLRNWYSDLPHNAPPHVRQALARQVDAAMGRVRAAERRESDARRALCQHEWEQIELDWQECRLCGFARQSAYRGWQE